MGTIHRRALRRLSLVAVLAVVAAVAARDARAARPDDADPVEKRLDAIVALWESGTHDDAVAQADAAVAEHPTRPRAWNVLGWIRLQQGKLDDAEASLGRALAIEPRYASALLNRGIVQLRRKDREGALAWFDRALEADPRHVPTLLERGAALRDHGRAADARKDFEAATKAEPKNARAWQNLGWIEQSASQWLAALRCYRRALELAPRDAWTLQSRSRCWAEVGQVDAALDDLDAAAAAGGSWTLGTALRAEEVARDLGRPYGNSLRLRRREAETIRGLRFRAEVQAKAIAPAEAGAATTAGMDDDASADDRRARTRGLVRLGLLAETSDVGAARAATRRSQIAGYYDPGTKDLFVVGSSPAELDPTTTVHEFVHALQDQHFDLAKYRAASLARHAPGVADEDLEIATRMVPEGDATLVVTIRTIASVGMDDAVLRSAAAMTGRFLRLQDPVRLARASARIGAALARVSADDAAQIDRMEPYVLVAELAPYVYGLVLTSAVYEKGGWGAVNALYARPPRTTEQCLHPEQLSGKRDEPTRLPFAALAAPAGWKPADARVLGELNAAVLLATRGLTWKDASAAAAGWDGDLLRTWTAEDGRAAIAWATTWDSDADAAEFLASYRRILGAKYPKLAGLGEIPDPPAAADVAPTPAAASVRGCSYTCGDVEGAAGIAVVRGREVFVVEGFGATECRSLLDTMLAADISRVE